MTKLEGQGGYRTAALRFPEQTDNTPIEPNIEKPIGQVRDNPRKTAKRQSSRNAICNGRKQAARRETHDVGNVQLSEKILQLNRKTLLQASSIALYSAS